MAKESKKITLGLVLSWIFGVLFGISGLTFLFSGSIVSGGSLILASLVLLPPMNKFVKEKFNFELSRGLKITLVIILFVIYAVSLSTSDISNLNGSSNINQQNTQTPPSSISKSWHEVTSFSGKGNQDTSSFYIKGGKVRITATTCCGSAGIGTYSAVDLEGEGGGYLGAGLSISTDGSEEGQGKTTYRNLDAGEYYISVITGVGWEVKVEEYY